MIGHDSAVSLLTEAEHRRLVGEERASLDAHLATCHECAEIAETYSILAKSMKEAQGPQEHPSSEQLAALAVANKPATDAQTVILKQHVDGCDECREHVELCTRALHEARMPALGIQFRPAAGAGARTKLHAVSVRLALAAGLVGFFIAVSTLVDTNNLGPPETSVVEGESLLGTQVIRAAVTLSAGNVRIKSGSDITLQAGRIVAIGDGFAVDNGASLTVKIENRKERLSRIRPTRG